MLRLAKIYLYSPKWVGQISTILETSPPSFTFSGSKSWAASGNSSRGSPGLDRRLHPLH